MQRLKRYLGIVWMLLGPLAIAILIWGAANNINPAGTGDINKPLPWIIIIAIFTPIAIGLTVFGWYAWKGEYSPCPPKGGDLGLRNFINPGH
jgi:type VI protein secretion system component VasK